MKTTVIIPNFNGMQFLPDCIASLRKQTAADFDVLVVDNGSTDGSVEWLKEQKVRSIFLHHNLGFAGGVNAGLRATHTPYVLLLNNDTVAQPAFVEELEKAIEGSAQLFSVSAMMLKASDHSLIDSAGDGMTIVGWAYQRGVDEPAEEYRKGRLVFSSCAGAAIYRREIFDEIGYFDENHFAYLEDVDLCYRARLAGYRNYYCPRAKVYHLGSATSGSKYNPFKVRLSARNNVYLLYKNQPFLQRLINLPWIVTGTVLKAAFFAKKGFFRDYTGGVAEGLQTISACKPAKRARHGIITYLAVEWELILGMIEYTKSFLKRHIG